MSPDNQKRLTKILDDANIRYGSRTCPECKTDMRSADADWLCPGCFLRVPKHTACGVEIPPPDQAIVTCSNPAAGCHKTSSCDCPVDTPQTVTELVNMGPGLREALLAQREQLANEAVTPMPASETLARLYESYQLDEGRAAQMAEYARRSGLWPISLDVKAGCPCPGCNWGHLSYNVTDKSIACVHGLMDGCGVHFSKSLRAMLKTETPAMIVRAMMLARQEEMGNQQWPKFMRVSHAMGNAFERELLLATKIDLPAARSYVEKNPQPQEQLRPGERFLCNFDGVWIIQRRMEDEAPRPERRKAPRYDAPRPAVEGVAYTRDHPRHAGMATLGDLARELNKEGLDLFGDVRLSPAACAAIRNNLRDLADNGIGTQRVPLLMEVYIGPWFVALLGGEDKLGRKPGVLRARGRDDEWQEEVDRQRAAEAMYTERQVQEGAAIARHGSQSLGLAGLATPDL